MAAGAHALHTTLPGQSGTGQSVVFPVMRTSRDPDHLVRLEFDELEGTSANRMTAHVGKGDVTTRKVAWTILRFSDGALEFARLSAGEERGRRSRQLCSHAPIDVAARHHEGHALEHRHVVERARIHSDHIGRFA